MTFCILLDTSSTMGEQCSSANAMTKMDIGKCVAESLLSSVRKSKSPLNPQIAQVPLTVLTPGEDYNCIVSYLGDPPQIADGLIKNINYSTDVTKESNISFPISQAITMTNKYRMRGNIDTFGFGRYPIVGEPLKVFVITDGVKLMQSEHIIQSFNSSAVSTGNDFSEPLRWDQQFYVILVQNDARCRLPSDLVKLCEESCGGIVEINSVDDVRAKVSGLLPRVVASSLGVVIHDEKDTNVVNARAIVVKETAEWPIPESYIYKKTMHKLPCRKQYPDLCILKDQTVNYASLTEGVDISFDSYEITSAMSPAVFCASFSLNQGSSYAVSVIGTGDEDVSTRSFTKRVGDKHSLQASSGILKYKKDTGSITLTLLPYNFTALLPVLKAGLAKVKTEASSAWAQAWRREFEAYLGSVPPNYHQSILNLLMRAGLKPIYHQGSLSSPEFSLSTVITKKLEASHNVAVADIAAIEKACCDRWVHTMRPRPEDLVFQSNRFNKFPRFASDVRTSNLLSEWEAMRSNIFGGPSLTLRGLTVPGIRGVGGWVSSAGTSDNDWFSRTSGSSSGVPSLTMSDAGDYQTVLASRECLRDPALLVVPEDEDAPAGVMRRKFDVNFGSKFKKAKGGALSDDREIITHEELFLDSPFPSPKRQTSSISDRLHSTSSEKKMRLAFELFPRKKSKLSNYDDSTIAEGTSADAEGSSPLTDAADDAMLAPESSNVPAGWKKLFSQRENRHYYFNAESGQSSWILSSITAEMAVVTGAATPLPALDDSNLPSGWKKCFSKRENRFYYFHSASKQSSWVVPT